MEMTKLELKDFFAGVALIGLLASDLAPSEAADADRAQVWNKRDLSPFIILLAFDYAEAMMRERERRRYSIGEEFGDRAG